MNTKSKRVIIVGAGFGGLSAACYLAKVGHQVTIIEKNSQVGGRATTWSAKGFLFDLGPSWYLMPDVFQRFFKDFGTTPGDFYKLQRLNPAYRIFFDKNDSIELPTNLAGIQAIFESLEAGGGKKIQDYLVDTGKLYRTAMEKFVYRAFDNPIALLDLSLLAEWRTLVKIMQSYESYVSRYFSNPKAKKILEYACVFLGGSPYNTPALYSLLSYVDMQLGVWYPQGGFGEVPKAMASLAQKMGVKIVLNHEVTGFGLKKRKIDHVVTDSKIWPADLVVSNADYHFTETQLLPIDRQQYPQSYWRRRVMAPSAYLIFLGLKKKLKNVRHHTLILDPEWNRHFDQIFHQPAWPDHPSYYVCTPSVTDASVAPPGKENIFILVPIATDLNDNDGQRDAYCHKIIKHLETILGQDISRHILVKRVFSQRDFIERYHAYRGTALGLAHTLKQTALFRPKVKSNKVDNLFYCGGYVHPGIGTAPSVISGKIAAEVIQSKLL